jgi:hypothetical protein
MKIRTSALPFHGLGFDLEAAHERAMLMNWQGAPIPETRASGPGPVAPVRVYGRRLLVGLSREIRGS